MADRPILFSGPMVRAILAGRKTQTRRALKHGDHMPNLCTICDGVAIMRNTFTGIRQDVKLPYAPGDRLWVKEAAWIAPPGWTDSPVNPMGPYRQEVAYKADDRSGYTAAAAGWKLIGETPGRSWSVPSRPRADKHPIEPKFLFELELI